jgi:ubiquitin-like-conjugating enzyme ATG3
MAKRAFYEKFKEVANQFTGPMTISSFQKSGKLTPQEFIEAGDALVQKCPAWEWASGDKDILPFLPPEKKFLILRNAPCNERASTIMDIGTDGQGDDEWECPGEVKNKSAEEKKEEEESNVVEWGDDDDDDDEKVTETSASTGRRIYDLTVVYDQYYASPRVYLFGYSNNQPMSKEQMMEDVYSENREKTVTVDPHPFMKTPCISIHPCRHAETMQRILQRMSDRLDDEQEEAGISQSDRIKFVFPAYLALFVFLKFISSVVPTIQYDISMDLDM